MAKFEHKRLQLSKVVVAEDDMIFSGYASVFGVVDSYDDVVDKGAFANTVNETTQGKWPLMLSQHGGWGIGTQDMTPVGIWTDMREDDYGLVVKGKLAETDRGKELYTLMKMDPRPAINGLSIGYFVNEYTVVKTEDKKEIRHLTNVDLVEISIVSFPANHEARITDVKTLLPTIRDAERALRDAGFSRTESKQILSSGYKSLSLRDAEDSADDEIAALLRRNIAMLSKHGGGCAYGRGQKVN